MLKGAGYITESIPFIPSHLPWDTASDADECWHVVQNGSEPHTVGPGDQQSRYTVADHEDALRVELGQLRYDMSRTLNYES